MDWQQIREGIWEARVSNRRYIIQKEKDGLYTALQNQEYSDGIFTSHNIGRDIVDGWEAALLCELYERRYKAVLKAVLS